MISPDLLKILCCPETRQPLTWLNEAIVREINQKISAGKLLNHGGNAVTTPIEGGLVRQDGRFFYPMRGNIPVLLVDEAIPL